MNAAPEKIACRALSLLLIGAFAYYWIFTLSLVFFYKPIRTVSPRQVGMYSTFWRQNWQLFAHTKVYNRQLNLLVHDRRLPGQTDTLDIIHWCLSEKRRHAPFNNYQDGLDLMLYFFTNKLQGQTEKAYHQYAAGHPGLPDSSIMLEASRMVTAEPENLHNPAAYAKMLIKSKQLDTSGRSYSLQLVQQFIPPSRGSRGEHTRILFQSPIQPFR